MRVIWRTYCHLTARGRGWMQFIMVNVFSKLTRLYPLSKATTKAILNKIKPDYLVNVSVPRAVLHDHGKQFTSRIWLNAMADLSIGVILPTIRHPQGNPSEWVMGELGRMLRTYCHDRHTAWVIMVKHMDQ